MKILRGRLHLMFSDLAVGDTFLQDNKPFIKVTQSAGSKLKSPPHNAVDLESGILYVVPQSDKVMKAELGITGVEGVEIDDE